MSKKASNEVPLDTPVSALQEMPGALAETTGQNVAGTRRFQVNDVVRIIAEGEQEYVVLVHRDHEPCCQIQRNDPSKHREWMISEELELVPEPAVCITREDKDAPSGLPKARVS